MAYDVSSWFVDQTQKVALTNMSRKFFVSSQDLSSYVVRWPTIERKWNDIRAGTLNIPVAAENDDITWLVNSALSVRANAAIEFGFITDSGTIESITLFSGTVRSSSIKDGAIRLTLANKFKQLTERVMGTPDAALDYTNSGYYLSDMAWYTITSYGGLSAISSSSNPDIDYESFSTWDSLIKSESTKVKGWIDGKKCAEILNGIAEMSDTAIYEENGKIKFSKFSIVSSHFSYVGSNTSLSSTVTRSDDKMVNRMKVAAGYDVDSRYFSITVQDSDSESINSYGLVEDVYENSKVWFVDSASAINLAQRKVFVHKTPELSIEATITMHGILRQIGEMIIYQDDLPSLSDTYRIMSYKVDLDQATLDFELQNSQTRSPFTLDVSALDGTDVLT